MATFYGVGRSNYIKVKDKDAFKEFIESFNNHFEIIDAEDEDGETLYGLISESDDGDLPYFKYDENGDEVESFDFMKEISEHLAEEKDNIFVWMMSGHEKMRYIGGDSVAINHEGVVTGINLRDIYELCRKEYGVRPATEAEY